MSYVDVMVPTVVVTALVATTEVMVVVDAATVLVADGIGNFVERWLLFPYTVSDNRALA